jgi:Predicted nucleotide-binding protein containing TIR-like domain
MRHLVVREVVVIHLPGQSDESRVSFEAHTMAEKGFFPRNATIFEGDIVEFDDGQIRRFVVDVVKHNNYGPVPNQFTSVTWSGVDAVKTVLFFSWQSDHRTRTNKIREALRIACDDLRIRYDEATRDLPGSPDIVQAVLSKIDTAHLFVADLALISSDSDMTRRCPNPNVMFELGYASARLSSDRILILYDDDHAYLPFDVAGRRVSPADKNIMKYVEALQKK